MKLFISTLLFLGFTAQIAYCVTPAAPAAFKSYGGYNSSTVAGVPGDVIEGTSGRSYFMLSVGVLSLDGSNVHYPLRRNGVIYQVTAAKTCRCEKIRYRVGSASGAFGLVSATATFANATASAGLTGGVLQSGVLDIYSMSGHVTANAVVTESIIYTFGASTFPGVQMADNTQLYQVYLWCYEY